MFNRVQFNTVDSDYKYWVSMNGLERVLEELMGESAWLKVRSDLYPESAAEDQTTISAEKQEPLDWEPIEPCFVCQGNSQDKLYVPETPKPSEGKLHERGASAQPTSPAEKTIDSPNPIEESNTNDIILNPKNDPEVGTTEVTLDLSIARSPSTPTTQPPFIGSLPKSYITGESETGILAGALGPLGRAMGTVGALGHESTSPRLPLDLYTANLPHHLLPWILHSHLHQLARVHHAQHGPQDITLEEKDQQPLDLSAKSQLLRVKPEYNSLSLSSPNIIQSSIFPYERIKAAAAATATSPAADGKMTANRGRRRGDMSKRSYTEEELQAALRDIQSGKLGTRRAAVIYGIPRSTLRNKVYKLATERERNKKLAEQTKSPVLQDTKQFPPYQNGVVGVNAGSDNTSNSNNNSSCIGNDVGSTPESLRALLKSKMAEKLKELNKKGLGGEDNEKVAESALKYLMENIPNIALNKDNKEISTEILSSISYYPQLSDFIKRVVEERYNEELQRSKSRLNGSVEVHTINGFNDENCDLTVPSYSPSCNGYPKRDSESAAADSNNSSQPLISSLQNSNLKEMIAQMIGQRLGVEASLTKNENSESISEKNYPLTLPFATPRDSSTKFPGEKREQGNSNKKISSTSPSSTGGKGSRPKRGKYRNYDRDNLLKAVQAVQSGEMSVHRAGSFYGVPHSTLEYKVKERHLTRGKNKREPSSSGGSPATEIKKEIVRKSADTTSTIDLTGEENLNREEGCDASPANKKARIESDATPPYPSYSPLPALNQASVTTAPIIPSPFSLWNGAPMVPSFLSRYQQDPFYATQMIRRFQEAAAAKRQSETGSASPPPISEKASSPMHEPSASPPFQGSVLDALLRGKTAAINSKISTSCSNSNSTHSNSESWQVSSNLLSLSKGVMTEHQKQQLNNEENSSTPPLIQPQTMTPFNALYTLPVLAPRNSLAAAFQQHSSPRDTSSPEVDILPLPLVKESCHPTPVAADQP